MANANSTLFSDAAIRLQTFAGDYCNCYLGTETELVEAGIVKSEWLPGLHGNALTTTRAGLIEGEMKLLPFGVLATRFQKENGLIHIWKRGKTKFEVQVAKTQEEVEREIERQNAEREREELRGNVERIHAEKRRKLDAAPKSPKDFRESKASILKGFLEGTFNLYRRADNGYHYSMEVIEQAHYLICDLLELAEDGKVYFDKVRYQHSLDDIGERDVKAHPEFSAFMAATLAIGKAAVTDGEGA